MEEVRMMKDGKETFKSFFRSKEGKINKITELTESIQRADRDIECLDLLYKIVVLQLNQAAINFFKREKFGTYNHTINLYSVKQIENNSLKHELFKKLRKINLQTSEAQLSAVEDHNKAANRITVETAHSNQATAPRLSQAHRGEVGTAEDLKVKLTESANTAVANGGSQYRKIAQAQN